MNKLTFEEFVIPASDMGEDNCLPDMMNDSYIHAKIDISDNIKGEDMENIGKGMINTLLPYKMQDGYNRLRTQKKLKAAILENDFLKAVFVTEYGGRLWSLFDKKANRELLYANNVFQPCNLALRNAWFSGGVEWNIGIKGHNPLTCSPMFAQRLEDKNGDPILKMYEFERIREVAYSISAKLEKDLLLVHINIENTEDKDKYMYWWSNIAVEETEKVRVFAPAEKSFYCTYSEGSYQLDIIDLPNLNGKDVTYATNLNSSRDFFYKIPDDEDKWIAAVNGDGRGLVHMSDKLLLGRKLFVWGQGTGGRHWNEWLSDCGRNYIEIQAGLLKTQLEHFVMKANSSISFTEGYSPLNSNSEMIHGDYFKAQGIIKKQIKDRMEIVKSAKFDYVKAYKPEHLGSGWAALENIVRDVPVSKSNDFTEESLGKEQEQWLELINKHDLPELCVDEPIISYVKGDKWIKLLEKSSDNWNKYYQLGVLYYQQDDADNAKRCFEKSIALKENAWSYRNLAQLKKIENNIDEALNLMEKAVNLKKDYQPLLVNCAELMILTHNYAKWISLYNSLSDSLKENGRLKMLFAYALNKTGEAREAARIITKDFVMYDIREGEFSLSHLWLDIYRNIMLEDGKANPTEKEVFAKYPLPKELDFRMH